MFRTQQFINHHDSLRTALGTMRTGRVNTPNGNKYQKFKQIKFAYAAAFLRFAVQTKGLYDQHMQSVINYTHTTSDAHTHIDTDADTDTRTLERLSVR